MKKIRNILITFLGILLIFSLAGCQTKANYVGRWQTDIFDQGNSRENGTAMASTLLGGGLLGQLSSFIADQLHFNATLELKEDGTAIIDSGMEFTATWYVDGDHIVIEGDNISGTATVSKDNRTLYFKNTIGDSSSSNGLSIGQPYIEFEFTRLE